MRPTPSRPSSTRMGATTTVQPGSSGGLVRAFLATECGWTRAHTHKVPPPPIADPGVYSKLYLVLSALEVVPSMADVVYFLAFRRCSASYYTVRKIPNMQYSTSLRHNLFNPKWLSFGCDANLFLMKLCLVMISARWSQEDFAGHHCLIGSLGPGTTCLARPGGVGASRI